MIKCLVYNCGQNVNATTKSNHKNSHVSQVEICFI